MNPSAGPQPSILDKLKSFLAGSGILHNLATGGPGNSMPTMTPGAAPAPNNQGLFANGPGGGIEQANNAARQAVISQAASNAPGGIPTVLPGLGPESPTQIKNGQYYGGLDAASPAGILADKPRKGRTPKTIVVIPTKGGK